MKSVALEAPLNYGSVWQDRGVGWWSDIHGRRPAIHASFAKWMAEKAGEFQTVLEVGCGAGVYPLKHFEMFGDAVYTGLDISAEGIKHCAAHSDSEFICADFLQYPLDRQFDLVFSHATVDHVYDPDEFLRRIVSATGKCAFVSAYAGYHENLGEHDMRWCPARGCYDTKLSVPRVNDLLGTMLTSGEYSVRPDSGEAIIEICRVTE
jgi:SAM-dependent methyltransferase